MFSNLKTICLAGTRPLIHAYTAILSSRGFKTRILELKSPHQNSKNYQFSEQNNIMAEFYDGKSYEGSPEIVSNDPRKVLPGSEALFFLDNCSAWEMEISEICNHLPDNIIIGSIPGGGSFEWLLKDAMKDNEEKYRSLQLFELSPSPYECRIETFGKSVHVMKEEKELFLTYRSSNPEEILNMVQDIFKSKTKEIFPFLAQNFLNPSELLAPARLFRLFEEHEKGKLYKNHPELYTKIKHKDLLFIEKIIEEVCHIGEVLKSKINVDFPLTVLTNSYEKLKEEQLHSFGNHLKHRMGHQLPDNNIPNYLLSSLCPMERTGEEEFKLDFNSIYFREFIPHKYCYMKGVASLLNIDTPFMDKVILWSQKHMEKEYLIGDELIGEDVKDTSAPQKFGFKKIEALYV